MKHLYSVILIFLISLHAHSASLQGAVGADVLSGKEHHFSFPSESKATVFVFMSAKCPCSASHEELLKKLHDEFKEFSFVGVHANSDENAEITKQHFANSAVNFPIIQDQKSVLANKLGAVKTPHVFVVNQQGETIYQGGVTDSHVGPSAKKQYLKEVLEDLRAGKTPRYKEVRTLGCYIQREDD